MLLKLALGRTYGVSLVAQTVKDLSTVWETWVLSVGQENLWRRENPWLTNTFSFHKHLHVCMLSHFSCVWFFVTPWTVKFQAPLSMRFPWQEYWSGLLFLSPGDLPNPGTEPQSPAFQVDSLPSEPPGKPLHGPCENTTAHEEQFTKFACPGYCVLDYILIR